MNPIEAALIVIAFAFVVLVIFLVRLIIKAQSTLKKTHDLLGTIQKQLDTCGKDPQDLLHHITLITHNIHKKLKNLDPMFTVVENLGLRLENSQSTPNNCRSKPYSWNFFKQKKQDSEGEPQSSPGYSQELTELGLLGLRFWQKYQNQNRR